MLRRNAVLRAHQAAVASARAYLRAAPRPRAGDRRITFLLFNAYGMGGTVRTTLNVAGALAAEWDVEVVSVVRHRDDSFFPHPPGVRVRWLEDRRGRTPPLARLPSLLLTPSDRARKRASLWTDLVLLRYLATAPDGVLIATRPALNIVATLARRPGLAVVGADHMNFSSYRAALREEIRRAYPQLDALVVLTRADLEEYRREIPSLRRLVQIPNAVPPVDGAGTSDLAAPVLLAAGRLTPQKGFDRLLRAWAHVAPERPEWRLRICGDGPQHKALRKLVGELGIADRVDLAGRSDDLGADMAAASLFVLSSRFEGLPMVLLEAMSRGLPVVGFDCPTGPREVISDGTDGILVRNGDEPGLARAIASVTADPDARRRLGAAAAAKASEFSLEAILPRWHELLRSLT